MSSDVKINVNFGPVLLFVLLGFLESFRVGVHWATGMLVGLVLGVMTYAGLFPGLGVIAYYFAGQTVMEQLAGVSFPITFVFGILFSVLYTIIMTIALMIMLR